MPNYITNASTNFPTELVPDIFSKVKGHSALAKLSKATPIAFSGNTEFVFTADGEASIVTESGAKPQSDANMTPVTITPLKFVYQHRVSDEFINCSEEKQLAYLKAFGENFAKKIARGLDIAAMHGVNPSTGSSVSALSTKNFDGVLTGGKVITYDASAPDGCIDSAVAVIQATENDINGIILSPAMASALGAMKAQNGNALYPEYRFGQNPDAFQGLGSDVNSTVSFNSGNDRAIIGDFENAFKWGYASDITFKVIEYGDPDNSGHDLQGYNQVCLRAEAYIGWAILDADAFALVKASSTTA